MAALAVSIRAWRLQRMLRCLCKRFGLPVVCASQISSLGNQGRALAVGQSRPAGRRRRQPFGAASSTVSRMSWYAAATIYKVEAIAAG